MTSSDPNGIQIVVTSVNKDAARCDSNDEYYHHFGACEWCLWNEIPVSIHIVSIIPVYHFVGVSYIAMDYFPVRHSQC